MNEPRQQSPVPAVTVVIPFHNPGRYFIPALQSVFAQSFEDWELHLINDCSTDDSLAFARRIHDPRVYVHSDGQRLGLSKRLNEGARLARAPFLIRMDADDMMHPLRIESQLAVLRDCGDNTVLGSACYSIDGESQPIGYRPAPMGHRTGFAARHSFSHPTVAARTDWFRRNPYSENPVYSRSEDAELWCRTAALSNFQQITRPLQFYREVGVFSLPNYLATGRGLLHLAGEIEQRHLQRTWLQTKECSKMTIAAVLHLVHATNLLIYRHFRPLTASEQADAAAALHRISQVALPLG